MGAWKHPPRRDGARLFTTTARAATLTSHPASAQEEINNTLPYDAQQLPDIHMAMKDHDKPDVEKKKEPLPEVPPMPMTVDSAYTFLGVTEAERGDLEKVKTRFRKMSLKCATLAAAAAPAP